jgi:hypothetical protein
MKLFANKNSKNSLTCLRLIVAIGVTSLVSLGGLSCKKNADEAEDDGSSIEDIIDDSIVSGDSPDDSGATIPTTPQPTNPNPNPSTTKPNTPGTTPVNNKPVASDSSINAAENLPSVDYLDGSDPDGDDFTFSIVSQPANGTLVLDNDETGKFTYTPNPAYSGADSFTYKVNDGSLDSSVATVSITVAPNGAPTTTDQSLAVVQNSTDNADTLVGSDPENNPITFIIVSNGASGTATITDASTGAYTYTPNPGFFGVDSFTFKVNDTLLDSTTQTVNITVTEIPYVGGYSSRFIPGNSSNAVSDYVFTTMWTKFTLSVWVKMANTPVANETLYSIHDPTEPRFLQIFWSDANTLVGKLHDGGFVQATGTVIDPLQWNHFVFTWDRDCNHCSGDDQEMRLYSNGVRIGNTDLGAGSIDFNLGAGRVEVGMMNGANHADAWIDDVAFWGDGLTANEVTEIYNSGEPTDYRSDFGDYTSSADLLHFWWMGDESTLPTIQNKAGNAPLTATGVTFEMDTP